MWGNVLSYVPHTLRWSLKMCVCGSTSMMSFLVFQCVWESCSVFHVCYVCQTVYLWCSGTPTLSVCCVYWSVTVTESILSSWAECICQCLQWCACGTVKQTDIALCPCHIWVTAQSLSPQPLSFSVLSAAISASVRSTCLMVCVIHSDCFPTSNEFVLLVLCACMHLCVCRERTGEWEPRWDFELLCICVCRTLCVIKRAWLDEILLLEFHPLFPPSFHHCYSHRLGNDFKVATL